MPETVAIVATYYERFNAGDFDGMLALLTDDVVHDINQGGREVGKAAFAAFMARMQVAYRETLRDVTIMVAADGTRAAAEFVVHGTYLQADEGMPPARGQAYVLPAGAFLTLRDGKIARVSMYYNLAQWLRQVA